MDMLENWMIRWAASDPFPSLSFVILSEMIAKVFRTDDRDIQKNHNLVSFLRETKETDSV